MELTEKHLGIPKAIASKYARPGTDEWEELVSVGNVALVKAAQSYKDGVQKLGAWLYHNVGLVLKREKYGTVDGIGGEKIARDRWKRLNAVSIDQNREDGIRTDPADRHRSAFDQLEDQDSIEYALRGLFPRDRAIYRLYKSGNMDAPEIASRTGVSADVVRYRLKKAEAYLKRRVGRIGCKRGDPRGYNVPKPPRTDRQRQASARYCRERALACRVQGVFLTSRWYLVDDERKLAIGPAKHVTPLMGALGIKCPGERWTSKRAAKMLAGSKWKIMLGKMAGERNGKFYRFVDKDTA